MRAPPLLETGATVALVAPSGPLRDAHDVDSAVDAATRLGWQTLVGDHVLEVDGYLAGNDEHRLHDFNRFARDPGVDGIWCIRGGYGAMRLLDAVDYDAWDRHPKTLIGFSDITALHAAIGRRAGLVTFHGPTARNVVSDFSRDWLRRATKTGDALRLTAPEGAVLFGGSRRGRLAGGNLALLCALLGTPYAPDLRDAILVLEDVNEEVYRIDRMLTTLRLSGAMRELAGIAFGQFNHIPDDREGRTRTLESVLAENAEHAGVPCLANLPVGHINDQWTVPLGRTATLDADQKTLIIEPVHA